MRRAVSALVKNSQPPLRRGMSTEKWKEELLSKQEHELKLKNIDVEHLNIYVLELNIYVLEFEFVFLFQKKFFLPLLCAHASPEWRL